MTISVDLELLLRNKLKIEEHFVLFCLINHLDDILAKYVTLCGKIEASIFQRLRDSGYLILRDESNISFDTIVLTEQTKKMFNIQEGSESKMFETCYEELLSTYPNKVKRITGGTRRLHNDLERCRKAYRLTLLNNGSLNVDLHKKIILCVRMYYQEHLKDNKAEFMQLLSTFLNQKTWEQYLSEVVNLEDLPKPATNIDAI